MGKLVVLNHPLIQHKLTMIRDYRTGTKAFRELVDEVATLMAFEITRDLALKEVEVETPVAKAKAYEIAGKKWGLFQSFARGSVWLTVSCN
ncbi:uracil phosphoribosyltransferase [Sporolactobacillus inulinus]|uniref:Uracil phosphoribosyltransferase n=1 Tax=Sporolactobacillus inulinus TaxID=2078 RepID=A0A4Y1ZFB4_9BACL|nr:uracil phosphoribosyltransferase [Sporolactobacillus inulinus]